MRGKAQLNVKGVLRIKLHGFISNQRRIAPLLSDTLGLSASKAFKSRIAVKKFPLLKGIILKGCYHEELFLDKGFRVEANVALLAHLEGGGRALDLTLLYLPMLNRETIEPKVSLSSAFYLIYSF